MSMKLELPQELLKAYKKAGGQNAVLLHLVKDEYEWWHSQAVACEHLEVEDYALLIKCINADGQFTGDAVGRRLLRKTRSLLELKKTGSKKTVNLEVMAEALREHLRPLPRHWVFKEDSGQMVPWFVDAVDYNPSEQHSGYTIPADVTLTLVGKRRGKKEKKNISFGRPALGHGSTAPNILETLELFPETEELVAQYEKELEVYEDLSLDMGEQFLAVGTGELGVNDDGEDDDRWHYRWHRSSVKFDRDGEPSKVIMDDFVQFGDKEGDEEQVWADVAYWAKAKNVMEKEEEEMEEASVPVPVPVQPYVCVFSLMTHEFAVTHINNLTPYEYDASLSEKLVLPADHRQLIDVLIGTTTKDAQDLIRGKKGGVVMLCSGAPGTGKTLTAEVYSEVAKRPLYTVQCSQLGVSAEDLEKELGRVLRRSIRWRAVLLIDEADVYIHERGTDVNQNAIVGVFLRLLEYYAGILFLTTNRETVTDDAVLSRYIAQVHYTVPKSKKDKRALWNILSTQYKVPLTPELVEQLIETFPNVSGRTVKQLCRLVQALVKDRKVDLDLFKWLAQFQSGTEGGIGG